MMGAGTLGTDGRGTGDWWWDLWDWGSMGDCVYGDIWDGGCIEAIKRKKVVEPLRVEAVS